MLELNPPPDGFGAGAEGCAGAAAGAGALLHPPKSSSCVILGGLVGFAAGALPQPPKSLDSPFEAAGWVAGCDGAAGAFEEPQTSFEPHGSELAKLDTGAGAA